MNTPKTFEPVVTEGMRDAAWQAPGYPVPKSESAEMVAAALAHPDFQRQLRAYAAEVARAMVPSARAVVYQDLPSEQARALEWNACRAATLSAIDEWEKNSG